MEESQNDIEVGKKLENIIIELTWIKKYVNTDQVFTAYFERGLIFIGKQNNEKRTPNTLPDY